MSTLSNSSPRGHHAVLISFSADEPVGETQASSRYALPGLVGMSEGRCPLLLHAYHPLLPFSSNPSCPSVKLFHTRASIWSKKTNFWGAI